MQLNLGQDHRGIDSLKAQSTGSKRGGGNLDIPLATINPNELMETVGLLAMTLAWLAERTS